MQTSLHFSKAQHHFGEANIALDITKTIISQEPSLPFNHPNSYCNRPTGRFHRPISIKNIKHFIFFHVKMAKKSIINAIFA
jgi:hypothetical protein